ncbi:ADP-ribose glycohydrolase MACROD2-like isoform X2 [Biomphalaria glabrata]|uniref:ADP-ribose glycohydrolase MACROD2-like isoform X2 n=1 Tax=Biomphalaria glabrata TaxID=6526 RepID=A0A9W2ZT76_BIOGL|nr:ADP-ribose glycohydrolase MACROD2-like isoform X2 [Biomphalaria glabrata]
MHNFSLCFNAAKFITLRVLVKQNQVSFLNKSNFNSFSSLFFRRMADHKDIKDEKVSQVSDLILSDTENESKNYNKEKSLEIDPDLAQNISNISHDEDRGISENGDGNYYKGASSSPPFQGIEEKPSVTSTCEEKNEKPPLPPSITDTSNKSRSILSEYRHETKNFSNDDIDSSENNRSGKKEKYQVEKEKYLTLNPEEKRKQYKCKKYMTLEEIQTWPSYFQENLYFFEKHCPVEETSNFEVRPDLNEKISSLRVDITSLEIDAIVNAANESLLGGGGVDGAIHSAAGPYLVQECATLNGCQTGEAKITGGYKLPSKYVIHTVGPRGEKPKKLEECYKNSLDLLKANNLKSIAFPCISTGIFGYPNERAAKVALNTIRQWLETEEYGAKVDRIILCLFLPKDVDIYNKYLQVYFPIKKLKDSATDVVPELTSCHTKGTTSGATIGKDAENAKDTTTRPREGTNSEETSSSTKNKDSNALGDITSSSAKNNLNVPDETMSSSAKNKNSNAPKDTLSSSKKKSSKAPDNTTSGSGKNTNSNAPDNTTSGSAKNKNSNAPKDNTLSSPKKKNSNAPDNTTSGSAKNTNSNAPKDKTLSSPKKKSSNAPDNTSSSSAKNTNVNTPGDTTSGSRKDKTLGASKEGPSVDTAEKDPEPKENSEETEKQNAENKKLS